MPFVELVFESALEFCVLSEMSLSTVAVLGLKCYDETSKLKERGFDLATLIDSQLAKHPAG